jgi:opacity protein-like surface antigen
LIDGDVAKDTDWRFAYQLMAGVNFNMDEQMTFGIEYRFAGVDKMDIAHEGDPVAELDAQHVHIFGINLMTTF